MKTMTTMFTLGLMVLCLSACNTANRQCGSGNEGATCPFLKTDAGCNGACDAKAPVVQAKENAGVAVIQSAALQTLLASGVPVSVLDARTGKFDDGNRIPGAKSLAPDAAKDVVEGMLNDKSGLIVTYCANLHCPASGNLAKNLRSLGYKNVLEYSEGIEGWVKAGNQVETVKK